MDQDLLSELNRQVSENTAAVILGGWLDAGELRSGILRSYILDQETIIKRIVGCVEDASFLNS